MQQETKPLISRVSLIQASNIPSRKCKLLSANVLGEHSTGDQFLFKPQGCKLQSLGLSSLDSLVTFEMNSVVLTCVLELGIVELL